MTIDICKPGEHITRLRIRPGRWKEFPTTAENEYPAEAIRDGEKFYYRAKGVTLPITGNQYRSVIANPFTYYFATALQLECRIEQAKVSGRTASMTGA
jgi:hypothetical protein